MSIFCPMPNEHIGSFIFRKHIFSGKVTDLEFTNEITVQSSNGWRLFPHADVTDVDLENYNLHTLIDLFRPTSAPSYGKSRGITQHRADYKSIEGSYCPACFRDQISEFGFFWFRREWLIYGTDCCVNHGCKLLRFYCGNCQERLRIGVGVQSLLRGRCVKCRTAMTIPNPTYVPEIPPMIAWANQLLKHPLPHLSQRLVSNLFYQCFKVAEQDSPVNNQQLARYIYSRCKIESNPGQIHTAGHLSEIMNRGHEAKDVERFLSRGDIFVEVPYLMFWWMMVSTFKNFPSFMEHIASISIEKNYSIRRKNSFEYLDLL